MAKRRKHMADWSQLPQDLLGVIANSLGAIEDFVSFSSVCSSWRTAVPKEQWSPCVPQLPWLMVTLYKKRFLLNLERKKLYSVKDPLLTYNNGWMFKREADSAQLTDPLTGFQITLPPFDSTKSIVKLVVSQRPPCDIVVVVMYYGSVGLRFAMPGFKQWIVLLQDDHRYDEDIDLRDVVCYKGRVFAVRSNGTVVLYEIHSCPYLMAIDIAPPTRKCRRGVKSCYLVESKEDLLFALEYETLDTTGLAFEVYTFNPNNGGGGGGGWTKLDDLGGCTMFLSHIYSVSILPSNQVDCRANCIYYTNLYCSFRIDCYLNVFDMKDKTTVHYSLHDLRLPDFRGSVWVMPSFGLCLGNV